MRLVVLKVAVAEQTFMALRALAVAPSGLGETVEEVSLYLILRGLADLTKDGVREAAHNKIDISRSVCPRSPQRAKRATETQPVERLWCTQCDRRVTTVQASDCGSPFCKAKAAAA